MEQKSVGLFIQELRKSNGLTQKQLAEKIGVSDKTISKWENGNSMPDTALLMSLCDILNVSVNELLSSEKLPPEDYSKKAEENIMDLLKDKEKNLKSTKVSLIIGIILGIISIICMFAFLPGGFKEVAYFLDFPSLLLIVIICAANLFASGAKSTYEKLIIVQKTLLPAGIFSFLFSVVIIIGNINYPEQLGPSIAVALLAPIYAVLLYIIFIPIIKRLEKK